MFDHFRCLQRLPRTALGALVLSLCIAVLQAQASPALGQGQPQPIVRVAHGEIEIEIDGVLDESLWHTASRFSEFRVTVPDTLVQPEYRTELLVLYTERGLYVGVDMEQPAADRVRRLSGRDARGINRDEFSLQIDPSGTGRYAYWVTLALGDNVRDGTLLPERRYSLDWDGAWYGATAETASGWSAEFYVPWSQMAMPAAAATRVIGLFGTRRYAVRNERWSYPPLPRTQPKFLSAFERVSLEGVQPAQQWSLFPSITAVQDRIEDSTTTNVSLDMFWRPSSSLQATASINPDFGAVEADDVIVNLTAIEAFFPEKRLFFLEGQEVFTVTPRASDDEGDPVIMVNTRRIGLGPRPPRDTNGTRIPVTGRQAQLPIDLLGAVKVTGQSRGLRYGLLSALEEDISFDTRQGRIVQSGTDYSALRLLQESDQAGQYRALGLVATLADHPERSALVTGLDGHWQSSDGRWRLDGLALRSDIDDRFESADGSGYGAFVDTTFTPRQGQSYSVGVSWFDDRVELNDLGFLQRNDANRLDLGARFRGSASGWLRNYSHAPFLTLEANGADQVTRAEVGLESEVTLANLWELSGSVTHRPARYEDRNSFGNGTYRIQSRSELSMGIESNSALAFSGSLEARLFQEDLGGLSRTLTASTTFRPDAPYSLALTLSQSRRDDWLLHQGGIDFSTFAAKEWRVTLFADYFQSARQQLRLSLQWVGIQGDEAARYQVPGRAGSLIRQAPPSALDGDFGLSNLNVQVRYRWQLAPLSDLFLVYTRSALVNESSATSFGSLLQTSWQEPVGDALVLKLRYRIGS